jgi:hypothetical protein
MWEAITYVTSGVTLAAFLAASAAWVYRNKLLQQERLIRTALESDRAALVSRALEFFAINTEKLTREQQFELALKQIHARASRFRITAIVVTIIALLAVSVALLAIYLRHKEEERNASSSQNEPSDLIVSSLDYPDRVRPLDGHPIVAREPRPIYAGGARVSLTLSHNKKGNHPIVIWGLKLELVKYDSQKVPEFTYAPSINKIIGSGTIEPRTFRVGFDGPKVRPSTWIHADRTAHRARSDNFLDTDAPRKLTVRSGDDDVEEVECTVLAHKTGQYEARFVFLYNVDGVDRKKYSESLLIYYEE